MAFYAIFYSVRYLAGGPTNLHIITLFAHVREVAYTIDSFTHVC